MPNEEVVNLLFERGGNPYPLDASEKDTFQLADDEWYTFSEAGRFVRKPIPLQFSYELEVKTEGGSREGFHGRGGFCPWMCRNRQYVHRMRPVQLLVSCGTMRVGQRLRVATGLKQQVVDSRELFIVKRCSLSN